MDDSKRASELNVRLYATGRTKAWAAQRLSVSREWLTKVLKGIADSPSLLDRIEDLIEELEAEDERLQLAA